MTSSRARAISPFLGIALFALIAPVTGCGGDDDPPSTAVDATRTTEGCRPPARYTAPADRLSGTGCVAAADPRLPAPGLVAYQVASPLWSDGAAKRRFFALPAGGKIQVREEDGHFELPVGTVLMKHFLFADRIFETRLFMRFSQSRWVGYSYAWDADGKDARLVGPDGAHAEIVNDAGGKQGWAFPSQSDCLLCHNDAAGFALGLERRQLDVERRDPSGAIVHQLAELEAMGLFDAPLPPPAAPAWADPAGPAPPDERARSYLHANCAICHRPGGKFPGLDLRGDVPLAKMGICQTDSTKGSAGATGPAQRLVPGHPEQSTLYTRMATLDADVRMPQLATAIIDPVGTALVRDWIAHVPACPTP